MVALPSCRHLDDVPRHPGLLGEPPRANGCQDCLPDRTDWVHLRRCLTCGRVLCCESSPLKHARAHAVRDDHPVVQSFEPGEDWVWCYADGAFLTPEEGRGSPSHTEVRG